MNFYLHPKGICESKHVGKGTRIHAFAHVLPNAQIGEDCNICDHVFIENKVSIGNRVTIKCGVQVWDGVIIEDDVFIGPNATFTNDPFPRSKQYPEAFSKTRVCSGASIGANATILPGMTIGQNSLVGAGSVVTRSVPDNAITYGNPARIVDYVGSRRSTISKTGREPDSDQSVITSPVTGVTFHIMPDVKDLRGALSVGLFQEDVPFIPKRYFIVFDVPSQNVRGEHAHKQCQQFLVCVNGACSVLVDDGESREEFRLDKPNLGLYIPEMVWGLQYKHTEDAVLLVFASHEYDSDDYIRDYQEWRSLLTN